MKIKDFMDVSELLSIKVLDYSSPCEHFVKPTSSVASAIDLMDLYNIRHLPVIKNGRPVGIVSDRDLAFHRDRELAYSTAVESIMCNTPYTVPFDAELDDTVDVMAKNKYGSAIVVNNENECIGILTTTDLLKGIIDILRGEVPEKIVNVLTTNTELSQEPLGSLVAHELEKERGSSGQDWV